MRVRITSIQLKASATTKMISFLVSIAAVGARPLYEVNDLLVKAAHPHGLGGLTQQVRKAAVAHGLGIGFSFSSFLLCALFRRVLGALEGEKPGAWFVFTQNGAFFLRIIGAALMMLVNSRLTRAVCVLCQAATQQRAAFN